MNKKTQMWVDPEFRRRIKAKAAENNKKVLEFTRELSRNMDELDQLFKRKKKVENYRFF